MAKQSQELASRAPFSHRFRWTLVFATLGVLVWWTAGASPRPKPPTTIGTTCQTSQCHSNYGKQGKSIHRPVKYKKCQFCHKPTQPRRHRFQPVDRSNQACFTCHRKQPGLHKHKKNIQGWSCIQCHTPHQSPWKKLLRKPPTQLCKSCHTSYHRKLSGRFGSTHKPLLRGQCLSCHKPHLPSPRRKLLRTNNTQMCVSCHRSDIRKMRAKHHKHPKVTTQCMSCHRPHRSRHSKLLRRKGKQLCLQCHKTLKPNHPKHTLASGKKSIFHKPVQDNCSACHTAHSSNHKGLLQQPSNKLCLQCHQSSFAQHKKAKSWHNMASKSSCLKCHQPHHSKHPKLQKQQEKKLCLSCHNKQLRSKQGHVIANIKAHLKGKSNPHKPIQKGQCSVCHAPHHSSQHSLLKKTMASAFYVAFRKGKFKLCFSCHKADLVTQKRTQATKFRNGTLNLHYIHVNKQRRGRNCSTCHDAHASQQPALIRSFVPYGKKGKQAAWKLPIKFRKTTRGGSCVSGCHAAKQYNRQRPIRKGYVRYPTR